MRRQNTRYFTAEEKGQLLRYLESHPKGRRPEMLYKLMFSTGLRLHEVVNLNVGDLLNKATLVVIGKGKKLREIPLSNSVRSEISKFIVWKKARGEDVSLTAPMFISAQRKRLGKRGVQYDLNRWVKRAGLEGKYSPHALRHTVGFELMRKTGNIRQVQEFLGHSFVTTTQIYTHVTKEELRNCAELLNI